MFSHYFFYSIVTPQFAIDLDKRKSNVNTFILLVQGLVCIFFYVTAGKCNVFKNHNKLLMCLLTPPPLPLPFETARSRVESQN